METNCGKFLKTTAISGGFWSNLRETARKEGLPYQWAALNDQIPGAQPSYGMRNFRAAAGKIKAEHGGFFFQDNDVAKWVEGAAHSLAWHYDAELDAIVDSAIDDIVSAQQPDGYLNTYYILTGLEKRWTNLMDYHELYCAGHMIEAAVAHYQATGKRRLLDAMIKFVAHIDSVIGPEEEGKLPGYPGHPVLEMALMKLYEVTKNPLHLHLAEYFIRQRGQAPLFFEQEIEKNHLHCQWSNGPLKLAYYQAHKPLVEQEDAVGHSVRALYLYSGLVDVARSTNDPQLLKTCDRMWESVVHKRMYITGAIGSSSYGEAFTFDYDLPNDTVYGETCASIALVFFAQRMLTLKARSEYADVMERALYNGVISGMQLDGKKFFYVNPLEVVPQACEKDAHKKHVRPDRQKWFRCACCPPNIIRLLMSLHQYVYSVHDSTLYTHLYMNSCVETTVDGKTVKLQTETNYPWDGKIRTQVDSEGSWTLALRIPGWCDGYTLQVNGANISPEQHDGYVYITRDWKPGDIVMLNLPMAVKLYRANPLVREDAGQVAVMRGPVVYCLEEKDNGNMLHLVRLCDTKPEDFTATYDPELLGGIVRLGSPGWREQTDWDNAGLYAAVSESALRAVSLRWIPYYSWANRGIGEMRVWIRE